METFAMLRGAVAIGCFGFLVVACGGSNPPPGGGAGGTGDHAGEAGELGTGGVETGGSAGDAEAGMNGGGRAGASAGAAGSGGNAGRAGTAAIGGEAGGGMGGEIETGGKAGNGGSAGNRAGGGGLGGGGGLAGTTGLGGSGAVAGGAGFGGSPAHCDGAPTGPDCACVKVTPDGDDASALASNGSTAFGTVQAAIDFASVHPEIEGKVCVAGGLDCGANATFPGPAASELTLRDGVSLYGSYESTGFTRCSAPTTTLAPATPAGVLFPNSITRAATLDGFRVLHPDGDVSAAVSVRGAKGVVISALDIEGGGSAVDLYGVDVSDGAEVTLRDLKASLPLHDGSGGLTDPLPTGSNYGVRVIGSRVLIDRANLNLAVDGSGAYGVWLESTSGAIVQNSTIALDSAAPAQLTGIHLSGATATLAHNTLQLGMSGGSSAVGAELVDAPNVAFSGTVVVNVWYDGYGIKALRSSVDAGVDLTLRGGTGVLLDTSPGSSVHGSITGLATFLTTGVQVTGNAAGTVIQDLNANVEGQSAVSFSDCAGAAPLVTGSSLRALRANGQSQPVLDTVAASGNCQPLIENNPSIVAAVVLPQAANGVHCSNGSVCTLRNNADIHVELVFNSSYPGLMYYGVYTIAGLSCDDGSCGDVVGNHVSGLALPPNYYQGRDTVFRGSGIVTSGGRVARNVVSAGCTGRGAGITATGGRLENNFVYGPTCGAGYLDSPSTGAALEISGWVDVNSNTLFGSAAAYYGPYAVNPCSEAGVRFHGGGATFRNNIVGHSGGCPGGDFMEVETATLPYQPAAFENNDLRSASYFDNGTTWLNDMSAINALGSGYAADFSADPGFADGMHLSGNSPCIDAGTVMGAPSDDFDAAARDSHPDVGADEWDGIVPPSPCTGVTCSGHGTCNQVQGAAVCVCSSGYLGSDCSSPNVCLMNNGGCDPLTTCTPFVGGRSCGACPADYTGTGETGCTPTGCAGNPCNYRGTCTATADGGHTCACPPGVTGSNCEYYFTALSAGDGFTCGLQNDGRIVCFGLDDRGQTDAPAGNFLSLSSGASSSCAVRTNLSLACWGDASDGLTSPPAGVFNRVSVGDHYACALLGNAATCWGALGPAPNAQFQAIAVGAWHACAIRTDGTVLCWGLDDQSQASPPPDAFRGALSLSAGTSCGIRSVDDAIECWGAPIFGDSPPSGRFSEIRINDSTACALNASGIIACWGNDPALPDDHPPGTFDALAVGAHHACGVYDFGLHCWGDDTYGEAPPPH